MSGTPLGTIWGMVDFKNGQNWRAIISPVVGVSFNIAFENTLALLYHMVSELSSTSIGS